MQTSYNEKVVKSLTKEQFLKDHPGKEADYNRITGSPAKVKRPVTEGYLKAHPELKDVKVGDIIEM